MLYKWIRDSLKTGAFPDSLKLSETTSIHIREDPFNKGNFRPNSTLPSISKVKYQNYDCLTHDLIIVKFEAYGFDNIRLKLFHSDFFQIESNE